MRALLRTGLVLGLLLGTIVTLAVLGSQTPWFQDWLRRYIVREAGTALNGQLAIGRLRGNLLTGVTLSDLALRQNGAVVLSADEVRVGYDVRDFLSGAVVLQRLTLTRPTILIARTADGWTITTLTKQRRPAEPSRAVIDIRAFELTDGVVAIDTGGRPASVRVPERLEHLDMRGSFRTAPDGTALRVDEARFSAVRPDLEVRALRGGFEMRGPDLESASLTLSTGATQVDASARAADYARLGDLAARVDVSPLSLQEVARFLPALSAYDLAPAGRVVIGGSAKSIEAEVSLSAGAAGQVDARLSIDSAQPERVVRGRVRLEGIDAGRIRRTWPSSAVSATADLDLRLPAGGRPVGTIKLTSPGGRIGEYRADRLDATLRLDRESIRVDGRVAAYAASATTVGTVTLATPQPAYNLRGRVTGLDLARLPEALRAPKLHTTLTADYSVSGEGSRVAGGVDFDESSLEGATVTRDSRATFSIGAAPLAYSFTGEVRDVDLPRLGRALKIDALQQPRMEGRLAGTVSVDGAGTSLDTLRVDASASLRNSSLLGGDLPSMDVTAKIAERRLDVRAAGAIEGVDPARATGSARLQGAVTGQLDVTLGIADMAQPSAPGGLQADVKADLRDSRVGEIELTRVSIDATYQSDEATIRTLDVHGPLVDATARGRVALGPEGASDAAYELRAADLAPLGEWLGHPLRGSAVVDGVVKGNRADLQTDGTVTFNGVGYGERFDALSVQGKYGARVPDLDVSRLSASADVTATLLKLAGQEVRTADLSATYQPGEVGFAATLRDPSRTLTAGGRVELGDGHRTVTVEDLTLATEGIEWSLRDGARPRIEMGTGTIGIEDLALVSGQQALSLKGTVATADSGASDLTVSARAVAVSDLASLALTEREVGGTIDANLRLTGTAAARTVDGDVAVSDGRVGRFVYERFDATVATTPERRLRLDAVLVQSPGTELHAEGTIPVAALGTPDSENAPLDVRVWSSRVDLGIVQAATDEVEKVAGQLGADVTVTGTTAAPRIDGRAEIADGAFAIRGTGASYSDLDASVRFEGDRVRIERLRVLDDDEHPLEVSGELRVTQRAVSDLQVVVTASGFEVLDNALGDIELDLQLDVRGAVTSPSVEGEVTVRSGRIELDRLLSTVLDRPYATEAEGPALPSKPSTAGGAPTTPQAGETDSHDHDTADEAGGAFARSTLDVRIIVPENLVVRGNDVRPPGARFSLGDVNLTLGGDVRLTKAPGGDVVAVGTVETVRGTYDFQGRRFTVERDGRISFRGQDPRDPGLDVTGVREISGVVARVNVAGSARRPVISLSSDPPLDEADVLSLIVFNAPVNQLGQDQQTSLAERAGALASGFVVAPIAQSLQRALDLDVFEVEAVSDGGGPAVTIGEQVGDRMFAQLRQQFGSQDVTEVLLEYRLADFLRLQGAFAEGESRANRSLTRRVERAGIDLVFVVSY